MRYKIFFSIFLLFLFSCSSDKEKHEAKYYYDLAVGEMVKGNFYSAEDNLETIESDHPYSDYSDRAEVLLGFLQYLTEEYDDAVTSAEKFIKLRPANKYVDYMYFLRAESYYKSRSDYLREQDKARQAKNSYMQLISRFAEKKYTGYSLKLIKQLDNELAHYNLDIGRTHLVRGEFIPAIRRFNFVIEQYPDTKFVTEARFRLVESYYSLGLIEQAKYESQYLTKNDAKGYWGKENIKFSKKYFSVKQNAE